MSQSSFEPSSRRPFRRPLPPPAWKTICPASVTLSSTSYMASRGNNKLCGYSMLEGTPRVVLLLPEFAIAAQEVSLPLNRPEWLPHHKSMVRVAPVGRLQVRETPIRQPIEAPSRPASTPKFHPTPVHPIIRLVPPRLSQARTQVQRPIPLPIPFPLHPFVLPGQAIIIRPGQDIRMGINLRALLSWTCRARCNVVLLVEPLTCLLTMESTAMLPPRPNRQPRTEGVIPLPQI